MRTPLARLVGLAAAASLIASPLAVAGPAGAAAAGNGTVTISIVNDLNQPVKGLVTLIDIADDSHVFPLGDPSVAGGVLSSYTREVPAGSYAITVTGGWSFTTCVGITPCAGLMAGLGGSGDPTYTAAISVADQGTASRTVTTATPKLTGTPTVGETLEVSNPISLGEGLGDVIGAFVAPKVTWTRNGAPIKSAKGTEYTLTRRDAGAQVAATIAYPPLLRAMFASLPAGADLAPASITAGPFMISKNASVTSVKVSGGAAYVRVSGPVDEVTGWVSLAIKGQRSIWAQVQDGFAPINLPALKGGKYTVTATYQGNGELNASSASTTIKVKEAKKPKKPKKPKKGKGKKH